MMDKKKNKLNMDNKVIQKGYQVLNNKNLMGGVRWVHWWADISKTNKGLSNFFNCPIISPLNNKMGLYHLGVSI